VNAKTTAALTALATGLLTLAQQLGFHVTSSDGKTATVGGIVAALSTVLHLVKDNPPPKPALPKKRAKTPASRPKQSTTLTMYDTITLQSLPDDAQYVAGYVDGSWPTYKLLTDHHYARVLSITVTPSMPAECLDIETGDAKPLDAPAWIARRHAAGEKRPVLYCDLSTLPTILDLMSRAGIARERVRLWTAHYTNRAHICGPDNCHASVTVDGTQWTNRALGRNLDESRLQPDFFA
jgi:hypothetical protein